MVLHLVTDLRFVAHHGLVHSVFSHLIELVDILILGNLRDSQSLVNDDLGNL